ncbi:DUF397 domain-containing protein [Actinomadura nitritigenes]|uniref:DUF397 domain-containing protein n=1 Tax=Actinomadura nitritigenes TaxID=134602 RepID=UPI00369395A4
MTAAVWRKSNESTNQGGECVEVAALSDAIGVRDSKDPEGGHLALVPNGLRRSSSASSGFPEVAQQRRRVALVGLARRRDLM